MRTRWLWLLLLSLLFVVPTLAQDTPPAAINAATQAVQNALGTQERLTTWTYQLLPETSNTNLGCLSVTGSDTGLSFTPYRFQLTFPSGVYIVHTVADGSRTVLCDPKLTGSATPDPTGTGVSTDACTANPVATLPLYTHPSTEMPIVSSLQNGTEYLIVGQSQPSGWLQVTFDNVVGWVEATSVVASPACGDVAITGYIAPTYTGSDCFASPAGAFANVRSQPNINGEVLVQVFENTTYQVTSLATAGGWYFIQYGWIAQEVVLLDGACESNSISVSDNPPILPPPSSQIESGAPTTLLPSTDVQTALTQYACPIGYTGYMPPRIGTGFANAAIEQGGIPNTLRAFPTTDDNIGTRLGTIQPGRTIDRVINGPVCNQGYVWWYVEVDGTSGWTAESASADSSYFIRPIGEQNIPQQGSPQGQAQTAQTGIPTIGQAPVQIGNNPILGIAALPSDVAYFATVKEGFGDAQDTTIAEFDLVQALGGTVFADVTGQAIGLAYSQSINTLVAPDTSGNITLINADPRANMRQGFAVPNFAEIPSFAVDSVGRIAWGNCTDASCNTATIALYFLNTGAEVWIKVTPALVNALTISDSGRLVASGSANGALQLWDSNNGALLGTYQETNQATLLGGIAYTDLAFNPSAESQLLIAGCNARDLSGACTQGRIGLINTSDATLIGIVPQFEAEVSHIAYYNNGSRFVSTDGRNIIVANAATGSALVEWNFTFAEDTSISAMVITEDDTRLLIGLNTGEVMMLDLTTVQQ